MLLRPIRYFMAVAEYQSFTRAAAALHVSQPALSQQIRQLEDMLGAQLFDRTGRAMRLTDAGLAYFQHARKACRDLEEGRRAIHDVGDLSRGSLRLAVTPPFASYLAGPLIELFHARHPNVTLTLREMPQERIETLLADDEYDVGIGFEEVRSSEIASQPLMRETLALVVGDKHPLAGRKRMRLQAMGAESLVLLTAEFAAREQIDRACSRHGIRPRILMETDSLGAMIEIMRRTALSTLLPAAIAHGRDGLAAIALVPPLLERTAVLMHRRGAYQTAAARAFIRLALQHGTAGGAGRHS